MTSFDDDDNALKYNEFSYYQQVALCIVGYNSRHNSIDFQHPHLRTLPVLSTDNICSMCPHFTRSNIRRSTHPHFTTGLAKLIFAVAHDSINYKEIVLVSVSGVSDALQVSINKLLLLSL